MVDRPVVVARVVTESADGWGECAALAAPTYSEEYAGGAWSVLRDHLVPLLLEGVRANEGMLAEPAAACGILSPVKGNAMAKACLEMALVDAGLRSSERSLADLLGARRDRVEAGAVVGLGSAGGNDATLLREVGELVATGYTRVKVKICPGADVGVLELLRGAFPRLGIQADANGTYRVRDPAHLSALQALDALDLLCIEQPLDSDDLEGHAELARRLSTPVCLDESIWSLSRLKEAISAGACDMVCIKPSRLGGLFPAVEAHDICVEAKIGAWCGGMLETSLARSANAALAALPGFVLPGDLSGGERFREPDPFLAGAGPDVPRTGVPIVQVHSGPGVGPAPDPSALESVTMRRHWAPI
jgi:O-succinylbenzoate synthase